MVYSIPYVLIPFFVGCCAQCTKICIDVFKGRALSWRSLWISGGFPSTHGTLTSSVMMLVLLIDGLYSTSFMIVSVLSFLVRYDATNVRYESGKHAQYINSLKAEINQVFMFEHLQATKNLPPLFLKERIGHTPIEVLAGIMYGAGLTFFLHGLLNHFFY